MLGMNRSTRLRSLLSIMWCLEDEEKVAKFDLITILEAILVSSNKSNLIKFRAIRTPEIDQNPGSPLLSNFTMSRRHHSPRILKDHIRSRCTSDGDNRLIEYPLGSLSLLKTSSRLDRKRKRHSTVRHPTPRSANRRSQAIRIV